MKNLFLLPLLAFVTLSGLSYNANFDPYGDDFTFPEYSDNLFIPRTVDSDCDGCYASCGTSSCAGSGCCTCSCNTFECACKPNPDPDPWGYAEPQIDISIDRGQYKNLKQIAFLLYNANDKNANEAYVHLSNVIKTLKEKDALGFHKEKELYFQSLAKIGDNDCKVKLNNFFEEIGVADRV